MSDDERKERRKALARERARRWRARHPGAALVAVNKWAAAHPEHARRLHDAARARYMAKDDTRPKRLASQAGYREANRDKIRAAYVDYSRTNAEKIRIRNAKWRAEHPDKVRASNRAWRLANPEKFRAAQAAWHAAHPENRRQRTARWAARHPERVRANVERRRARKMGARVVETINRLAIYARDGGKCHICKRKASPARFHLDHLVPLAKGGEHAAFNVAVAHPMCNARKQARLIPVQVPMMLGHKR